MEVLRQTRILPLVLVCIVAFAAASTIGFAVWSNIIQHDETAPHEGTIDVHTFAKTAVLNMRVLGDPINNPKPNKAGHKS